MQAIDLRTDLRSLRVRFTHLKHMANAPIFYRHAIEHHADTPQMAFGRGVHSIVLGGAQVVMYDGTRRGQKWLEFVQSHPGHEILSREEWDRAHWCADAIRANPDASDLLKWSSHERYIEWENCGRACRSTIDMLGHDYIADLKTANTVNPNLFVWAGRRLFYHAQLAWYKQAAQWECHKPIDRAYLVTVMSKAPFVVQTYELTPDALLEGDKLCRIWLEQLLACESANVWPGYSDTILPFDVPHDDGTRLVIDGEEMQIDG